MTSGVYVLYGGGVSRSAAVEAVVRVLALPCELVEVDTGRAAHGEPAFLRINPAGEVLHESAAIMLWLAENRESDALARPFTIRCAACS